MPPKRIATLFKDAQPEETVVVKGWVRTRRDSKNGFSFVELNDGSCMKNLQIVIDGEVTVGFSESTLSKRLSAAVQRRVLEPTK